MKKVGVILARFQPIHNGHIELIKKASSENDEVLVFIGSIDKLNARNPIPWTIRKKLVETALEGIQNVRIAELADLSDENDNSHDWGFYLYANIVSLIGQSNFTIYYSDGYEIITSWIPFEEQRILTCQKRSGGWSKCHKSEKSYTLARWR